MNTESEKAQQKRQRLSVGKRVQTKKGNNKLRVSITEEDKASFRKNPI
jgi:hypothetical protein